MRAAFRGAVLVRWSTLRRRRRRNLLLVYLLRSCIDGTGPVRAVDASAVIGLLCAACQLAAVLGARLLASTIGSCGSAPFVSRVLDW